MAITLDQLIDELNEIKSIHPMAGSFPVINDFSNSYFLTKVIYRSKGDYYATHPELFNAIKLKFSHL